MTANPFDDEAFCYLTTTGRVSGRPHTIEIWFAGEGDTLYLLSGGGDRSDWVRNLLANPEVTVRVGKQPFEARSRLIGDGEEDHLARNLVYGKYQPGYSGDLASWRDGSLPVALDLDTGPPGL